MHEIGIAEDLTGIVLDAAGDANLSVVTRVNVSLGQLIQVVPESFEFAFSEAVRDTIAEGCELVIEIIRIRMKCVACGNEFNVDTGNFRCDACGSGDLDIINGKELFVKSIEGE